MNFRKPFWFWNNIKPFEKHCSIENILYLDSFAKYVLSSLIPWDQSQCTQTPSRVPSFLVHSSIVWHPLICVYTLKEKPQQKEKEIECQDHIAQNNVIPIIGGWNLLQEDLCQKMKMKMECKSSLNRSLTW